jgi:hypothetical protein
MNEKSPYHQHSGAFRAETARYEGELRHQMPYLGCGAWLLEKRRAGALWLKARRGGANDGIRAMNEVDQADAEDLTSDVSDEALEAAIKNEAQPAWTTICTGITCPG